jgi:hypothetical protein
MICNPSKHQAMVIENNDYEFSFPINDSFDLLGMRIDKDLMFDKHVTNICKKVQFNDQFNVMKRFRNLISGRTVQCVLYQNFILPHFNYCLSVCLFTATLACTKRPLFVTKKGCMPPVPPCSYAPAYVSHNFYPLHSIC